MRALLQAGIVISADPAYDDTTPPQIDFFGTYWTVEYKDSGVGEDYVISAMKKKWPDYDPEIEEEGGCDSCGHGRTLTITFHGVKPPWGEV